jgi:hypothetical protein
MTLSEFNIMEIQRLEAWKIPTYEVRMKNAREKKQEKYDKLASKAFWNINHNHLLILITTTY